MIVDYENPLKKMMEEFVPHSKVCNHFSQEHSNLNWDKQRLKKKKKSKYTGVFVQDY